METYMIIFFDGKKICADADIKKHKFIWPVADVVLLLLLLLDLGRLKHTAAHNSFTYLQ